MMNAAKPIPAMMHRATNLVAGEPVEVFPLVQHHLQAADPDARSTRPIMSKGVRIAAASQRLCMFQAMKAQTAANGVLIMKTQCQLYSSHR